MERQQAQCSARQSLGASPGQSRAVTPWPFPAAPVTRAHGYFYTRSGSPHVGSAGGSEAAAAAPSAPAAALGLTPSTRDARRPAVFIPVQGWRGSWAPPPRLARRGRRGGRPSPAARGPAAAAAPRTGPAALPGGAGPPHVPGAAAGGAERARRRHGERAAALGLVPRAAPPAPC